MLTSWFPIPSTPPIIVKVEKHPCSAHHQHLLQRTTDQPVPTGHYPLSAKPFRLSTPLWDYTFSDVLIEPTQGQNPSINFSLCIHLDTSHLRAIKMFSTSWIKLLGLHQWYCLLFSFFLFFLPILWRHIMGGVFQVPISWMANLAGNWPIDHLWVSSLDNTMGNPPNQAHDCAHKWLSGSCMASSEPFVSTIMWWSAWFGGFPMVLSKLDTQRWSIGQFPANLAIQDIGTWNTPPIIYLLDSIKYWHTSLMPQKYFPLVLVHSSSTSSSAEIEQ